MIDTLLPLVPQYGLWLLGVTTFLSCLAVPVPSSLLMLAAGGFVSSGDLTGWQVVLAAFGGAVAGDQAGFSLGHEGGALLAPRSGKRAALMARAHRFLVRRGAIAIFLSRWLFSPLGPYMNLIAGATRMPRRPFSLASLVGEAVWVTLYVGLGALFADNIVAVADILGNASGLLAALVVAGALGLWLRSALRARRG